MRKCESNALLRNDETLKNIEDSFEAADSNNFEEIVKIVYFPFPVNHDSRCNPDLCNFYRMS